MHQKEIPDLRQFLPGRDELREFRPLRPESDLTVLPDKVGTYLYANRKTDNAMLQVNILIYKNGKVWEKLPVDRPAGPIPRGTPRPLDLDKDVRLFHLKLSAFYNLYALDGSACVTVELSLPPNGRRNGSPVLPRLTDAEMRFVEQLFVQTLQQLRRAKVSRS
ncbi:MAG: hypothetical protein OHK0029_07640 [Armatimonadaceae bacterium]